MPLVLSDWGQLKFLDTLTETLTLSAWPYKNDRLPKPGDTIDLYTEADFSGYSGPLPLNSWSPAAFNQTRAISRNSPLNWLHNGGGIDNYIFGVVVVDEGGELIWAERDPRAPVFVRPVSPYYVYEPMLTILSEYRG